MTGSGIAVFPRPCGGVPKVSPCYNEKVDALGAEIRDILRVPGPDVNRGAVVSVRGAPADALLNKIPPKGYKGFSSKRAYPCMGAGDGDKKTLNRR